MGITGVLYLEVCLNHASPTAPYFHIPILHINNFVEDNTLFRNRYRLWDC